LDTTPRQAPAPIDGHCDPRFARVRDAFASNFADLEEVGAAISVRLGGRHVVDLWGGHRDERRQRPWTRDTLVNAYSVGKGVLAVLVAAMVEQGRIDLDAPVSALWPEFAAQDKGDVTIRSLLCHRAGLPAVRRRLPEQAMYDWDGMCRELAAQAPYWEPGSVHGYHVNTYGFLAGELIRRATGLGVGDALLRHVTGPLDADFFYGLPLSDHGRTAQVIAPDVALTDESQWATAFPPTGDADYDRMNWHCYFNPSGISGIGSVNTAAWRLATIPSTNGHGTARAVAAIYSAFLAGGPAGGGWAGPGVRAEVTAIHADGEDRVLRRHTRYGLGFQLAQPGRPLGPNAAAFGHYGYGGSLGFADPDAEMAFGYLMNRPGPRWQTPRTQRLIDAVYSCL
jgi:CubicO group peptidase (beta-lactamase class C family)